MSDNIGLQADITGIPGAISALGSLTPILRALSADGVSPLAVIQLEAIGSRFPISGALAGKTVDALTRSGSFRLRNLQQCIGWMRGDTTWALSQTAGGQAAALLTLGLVEMFCRNGSGHLLFELSTRILPASHCLSNMSQLSDLAEIVSNKMQTVRFGQHLATQVTRIRSVYLHSDIEIPRSDMNSLLSRATVQSMVDILDGAQLALREDKTTLRIEGFAGMAGIVSLLTSLFEDDVLLMVENEVIYQGRRNSIVISVVYGKKLDITKEKVLRDETTSTISSLILKPNEFLNQPGRISPYDRLTMKTEGCLGRMVALTFASKSLGLEDEVISCVGNLVGAIIHSFKASDFGPGTKFPDQGLLSLLGTFAESHVRDQLNLLFGTRLSLSSFDVVSEYQKLRDAVAKLLPDSDCTCSRCPNTHNWVDMSAQRTPCYVRSSWGGLQAIIGYAIVLTFVEINSDSLRLPQGPDIKAASFFCGRVVRKFQQSNSTLNQKALPADVEEYSITDLHTDLYLMLGSKFAKHTDEQKIIGASNGAVAIFPSTLETLAFDETVMVRYKLLDGQFHDGINYYRALIEDSTIPPRPEADNSLLPNGNISLSNVGVHSNLTITARPFHNFFGLRTTLQVKTKVVNLSFYALQLAYMSTTVAPPCIHKRSATPPPPYADDSVVATGVEAPLASKQRFSVALVHGDNVAQFLAGVENVHSLFQGGSCLDCAMRKAQTEGYQLLIQS